MTIEYMADAPITKEWLEWYGDAWRAYESFLREKKELERRISLIKGVVYDREKISSGHKYISQQERYVLKLERKNYEISECEKFLFPAKKRLIQQLSRLKKHSWRQVLILFYIERRKLTDIVEYIFELEPDFEEKKDGTYLDTVKRWKREAIAQLEALNQSSYVPVQTKMF